MARRSGIVGRRRSRRCPGARRRTVLPEPDRWSIEVAIEDAKQEFGAGQARNRTANAVRRTVPFQLTCQTLAMTWYATAGHDPADVEEHRARAPWYRSKACPSTADMLGKLRRVLIAGDAGGRSGDRSW